MMIHQIGQDHDIGMLGYPVDGINRAVDRLLPVHLGQEEAVQQVPDMAALDLRAIMLVTQRLSPVAVDQIEMDVMRFVQPVAEGHDHVQQHLVTIGNQQGAAHASSSIRARTSASGFTFIWSAAATRSGSWASRKAQDRRLCRFLGYVVAQYIRRQPGERKHP
jgi:hypothetical protein